MTLLALLMAGLAVAFAAAGLSWLTYQEDLARVEQDGEWHVANHETIGGEWRDDAEVE